MPCQDHKIITNSIFCLYKISQKTRQPSTTGFVAFPVRLVILQAKKLACKGFFAQQLTSVLVHSCTQAKPGDEVGTRVSVRPSAINQSVARVIAQKNRQPSTIGFVAFPARLERATFRLGGGRSILLSYENTRRILTPNII